MDDLIADFLAETRVELDRVQDALARLEQGAPPANALEDIRIGVGAIRGQCAALGYARIAALAEGTQTLIHRLYTTGVVTPSDARTVRRAVDRIARLLATLAATGAEPAGADPDIAQALSEDGEAQRRQERVAIETAAQAGPDAWGEIEAAGHAIAKQLSKSIAIQIEPSARALPYLTVTVATPAIERAVRYACAYGIEHELVRRARGKRAQGTVRVSALNIGDGAVIAVSDDGAGIDLPRLKQRAAALKLISQAEADALDDARAPELIFAPGLSTYGEGATREGLDTARAELARAGGAIEVSTIAGRGATFLIRLPQQHDVRGARINQGAAR